LLYNDKVFQAIRLPIKHEFSNGLVVTSVYKNNFRKDNINSGISFF